MKKWSTFGVTVFLFMTIATPLNATAPKAGAKCTKAGTTATASGKNFTCIKSGTKLVWNKGVAVKKPAPVVTVTPTPTPLPEPTPTPTPTPTPIPTPTPVPTPKELTFSNVAESVEAIALNVFSKYEKLMSSNFQSNAKVNIVVGPNTIPVTHNPASAFQIASKFFQNFKQPEEVTAIYYSFTDREWAKQQLTAKAGKVIADYQFGYSCLDVTCNGASANITLDWNAVSHFGRPLSAGLMGIAQLDGELEIHEHTHSICAFQLKPRNGNYYNLVPDWFAEGLPTLAGKLGATTTLAQYNVKRNEAISRVRPQADIQNYRPENILRFYESFSKYPEVSTFQRSYLYSLGWSTIEAMAAIGGIDSPMNLYLETVNGLTFKQAFKKIYGIEWEAAAPILADAVSKQYRVYYP